MQLHLLILATCLASAYAGGETCFDESVAGCLNEINQEIASGVEPREWTEVDINHPTGYRTPYEYMIFQGRVTCLKQEGLQLSQSQEKRVYIKGDNNERRYCIKFKANNNDSGKRYSCLVDATQRWALGSSCIDYEVFCKPLN